MAETGNLSKADVYAACDDLVLRGIWVTNAAVHRALGRGSMVTINKYTRAWQTDFAEQLKEKESEGQSEGQSDVPADVLDLAQALYKLSIERARTAVEQDYTLREQALESERARIEQIRLDARTAVESAQRELSSHREAARVYKQLADEERATAGGLEEKLKNAERDLALALQQNEQQARTLEALTAKHEDLGRKAAEDLATEKARSDAVERRWAARVEEESARGREDRDRADQLARELTGLKARIEQQAEHAIAREQVLTDVRAQAAGQEVMIAGLNRDLEQLSRKYEQQAENLHRANRELSEHIGALMAREDEVKRLRVDLERANKASIELAEIMRERQERRERAQRRREREEQERLERGQQEGKETGNDAS